MVKDTGKKVPSFLKRDGDALLFNEPDKELIFYVPEDYFKEKHAIVVGEYVNILGILDYAIFDKNGKHNGLKRFYFPTVFLTKPYTMDKLRNVKLTETTKEDDYRALKYKKGDQVVVSVLVPQSINNVEEFFRLFLSGKLPTTVEYDHMHEYFLDNMKLNGSSYNVSQQLFGILVSEMARDKKDVTKAFRLSKSQNMTDYSTINIRDIPKYVDPFSSLTSENWDKATVGAIINPNHQNSPMEKLLTEAPSIL